jgi:hypothetical protein
MLESCKLKVNLQEELLSCVQEISSTLNQQSGPRLEVVTAMKIQVEVTVQNTSTWNSGVIWNFSQWILPTCHYVDSQSKMAANNFFLS